MTSWEGANVVGRKRVSSDGRRRASIETLEAALSRLSKSYSVAMDCVGACHRLSNETTTMSTSSSSEEEKHRTMGKVARAARRTLERGIFMDPLVRNHASGLFEVWLRWARGSESMDPMEVSRALVWSWVGNFSRVKPPVLTSVSHRSTVEKLSYLSLINYADLLLSGCSCDRHREPTISTNTILDRGVINRLFNIDPQKNNYFCCWTMTSDEASNQEEPSSLLENESDTVTLALVAYMDALHLDGSDPTIWVKMAAAARRLENIEQGGDAPNKRFRRFERHALECAQACCLQQHRPPSRILTQAWEEWKVHNDSNISVQNSFDVSLPMSHQDTLQLALPRYSRAVLGRNLARACRQGTDFRNNPHPQHQEEFLNQQFPNRVAVNPILRLHVPLILTLTSHVLGIVISYLDNSSIARLECTCRAFSVAVLAARARADHAGAINKQKTALESPKRTQENEETDQSPPTSSPQKAASQSTQKEDKAVPASRMSKRLQSQIENTGKRADRSSRRGSVEHCLVGAVLGFRPDAKEYLDLIREGIPVNALNSLPQVPVGEATQVNVRSDFDGEDSARFQAQERIGPGSLIAFVESVSQKSPTPIAALFQFLAHVSLHVDDVYSCESHGALVLTQCLMDAFDLLTRRVGFHGTVPCWSASKLLNVNLTHFELLAVDLLHAEFRLMRCERDQNLDASFDGDLNFLALSIPKMLQHLNSTESPATKTDLHLRVRCYWLLSGFLLWYSQRVVPTAAEVREVENECLLNVEKIMILLEESGVKEVRTPHLDGVGRSGAHWKRLSHTTLIAFRNEIQSSSIVLSAQDQFVEALSKIESSGADGDVSEVHNVLTLIGDSLLKRYEVQTTGSATYHIELVNDFLSIHGEELSSLPIKEAPDIVFRWFEKLVPLGSVQVTELRDLENPCILTIMSACLSLRADLGKIKLIDLFVNLIFAVCGLRENILSSPNPVTMDDDEASGQSDDISSVESESDSLDQADENEHDSRGTTVRIHNRLLALFLAALTRLIDKEWLDESNPNFRGIQVCANLIDLTFVFATDSSKFTCHQVSEDEMTEDSFILDVVGEFLDKLCKILDRELDVTTFRRLQVKNLAAAIVVRQQNLEMCLKKGAGSQNKKRKSFINGTIMSLCRTSADIGSILSTFLCSTSGKIINRSVLIEENTSLIAQLCRSLLWLWEISTEPTDGPGNASPLAQKIAGYMRVPLAVATIALCGAASITRKISATPQPSELSLMDFVDSDVSLVDCKDEFMHEELVRVCFLSTQCIRLVSEALRQDEYTLGIDGKVLRPSRERFLLPLVSTRVLNFFADTLLINGTLENDRNELLLWSGYEYGARHIGSHIDRLLHRAYKTLYGFNFANMGEGKDSPGALPCNESRSNVRPESVKAAAQLYRCVMRTCTHGRKSPPKAVLLTITAALPTVQETDASKTIKGFLFSNVRSSYFSGRDIELLLNKSDDWEAPFAQLSDLWEISRGQRPSSDENEAEIVRKGLAVMLSQGNMPSLENAPDKDARLQTQHVESELRNRFDACLYLLTSSNFSDCEMWFQFSQLCLFKADTIADRMGLNTGFSRSHDFMCEAGNGTFDNGVSLDELLGSQGREVQLTNESWTPSLGSDLSLFLQYSWSSVESLKMLQSKIGEDCRSSVASAETGVEARDLSIWNEIVGLYTEGRMSSWQEAWGGLFVSSLRIMAARCMCLALFSLYKSIGISELSRSTLVAEICEALGTSLYSSIVGSQVYGYPLHVMTEKGKRDILETAMACYTVAVKETEKSSDESKDDRLAWDLNFMIGKCHEKIARTFKGEKFESTGLRSYEENMILALRSYSKSVNQAQGLEKDGLLPVEQQGGSSHGAVEVIYRLHATRLKCLIFALRHCKKERDLAELEALRLTEPFPYSESSDKSSSKDRSVRDRIWAVAVDVVSAMVHCRTKHSCFHRSVYRHAQALMWAPMLCDPEGSKLEGSFGVVPAVKALNMRGLDSESAVESGASVMRALFDKKRPQLCGVWVTTTSISSSFQRLNLEVRKYDALRGKYISAFILCLKTCHKRDDLENLLRHSTSCTRDLPSLFAVSVGSHTTVPEIQGHSSDSLLPDPRLLSSLFFLTSVKREANGALASVILHDVTLPKASRDAKYLENQLKLAYSCFLRLNCDSSAMGTRLVRQANGVKPVFDALIAVYCKTLPVDNGPPRPLNDWSMDGQLVSLFDAAVQKCQALFPSLSGSFLPTKKNLKKKKTQQGNGETNQQLSSGSKRKEPDGSFTELKQFNVPVPAGVAAGESFLTEIQAGEKIKRIRLTVPEGGASNLRFNLRVPVPESSGEPP